MQFHLLSGSADNVVLVCSINRMLEREFKKLNALSTKYYQITSDVLTQLLKKSHDFAQKIFYKLVLINIYMIVDDSSLS